MTVYEIISNKILKQLEDGVIPWKKCWRDGKGPRNWESQRPYSGLNRLLLGSRGGEYLTYNQIRKNNGALIPGRVPELVIYANSFVRGDDVSSPPEKKFFLRYYRVWHIEDTEGIKSKSVEISTTNEPTGDVAPALDYIEREGITLAIDKDNRPSYSPYLDKIEMNCKEQYFNEKEWVVTLLHEIAHSTGHESRLKRLKTAAFFGDEKYSKEECIAEISSCIMSEQLGIDVDLDNAASYCADWGSFLKDNKSEIIPICRQAIKAASLVLEKEIE